MSGSNKVPMVVLSGNSHQDLTELICRRLEVPQGKCSVLHKTNRESEVEIRESVRGKDVYVVQTGTKNVNNDIMEMLIMAYACKMSCARKIVGVIPYLPYCKQSKMRKRGSIVSRLLADMLCKSGLTHVITMDLHQKEIQGFFNVPVDNLRASAFLIQYIRECIPDWRNAVLVARNPSAVNRASSYAERLQLGFAVIHGEKVDDSEKDDGRASPPPLRTRMTSISVHDLPVLNKKAKPPMNVVGDVGGKIAIIVDDLVDEVGSFIEAADVLCARGAYKIYVVATHGLLSLDAPQLIEDSVIDEVVVTNTIPHDVQKLQCKKIKTVDVSSLFVEAIRRIQNNESMAHLFKNVAADE
ncbi:phosphoribosyl pyrophosphate synthase-associated protein 2-like [Watersipora subatra]|uniref:phosphoribosyl pyrophosphate synthase-associated protein 2-like n=1 Tax=Watersipora subatra TaxID=2589382 RepID=UPI00355B5EA1